MDYQKYWDGKHEKYADTDWIDKPTLFALWAIKYLPKNGRLLDLGAGQGQDSRFFARNSYDVTSTDFSSKGQDYAKNKSKKLPIKFQQVDISQPLPYANESFDIVYAHLSLHYFDNETTQKIFAEIHRVLKKNGILAALLNSINDTETTEGKEIEENYLELHGIHKRLFSPESAREFAKDFKIIIADAKGDTYKDRATSVTNLIRLVCQK